MLQRHLSAVPSIAPTCGISYVAEMFGIGRTGEARSRPWQIRFVTKMIAARDFPKPLPTLYGEEIVERVLPRSRWVRAHVDAWFDDRLPPQLARTLSDAEAARLAAALDARANALGQGAAA